MDSILSWSNMWRDRALAEPWIIVLVAIAAVGVAWIIFGLLPNREVVVSKYLVPTVHKSGETTWAFDNHKAVGGLQWRWIFTGILFVLLSLWLISGLGQRVDEMKAEEKKKTELMVNQSGVTTPPPAKPNAKIEANSHNLPTETAFWPNNRYILEIEARKHDKLFKDESRHYNFISNTLSDTWQWRVPIDEIDPVERYKFEERARELKGSMYTEIEVKYLVMNVRHAHGVIELICCGYRKGMPELGLREFNVVIPKFYTIPDVNDFVREMVALITWKNSNAERLQTATTNDGTPRSTPPVEEDRPAAPKLEPKKNDPTIPKKDTPPELLLPMSEPKK